MQDLNKSREKIDDIDLKLLKLFEERMQLSKEIAEYKRATGKKVYDPERENEKIEKLKAAAAWEHNKTAVSEFFTQIMTMSRRLQYTMLGDDFSLGFTPFDSLETNENTRIAFYGATGSYTEQAMLEYFKSEVNAIPMETFEEVMLAVKEKRADYGVLPIENSATGTLSDTYDLLAEYDNCIIGEQVLKIEHHLWGLPGASLSDISKVYSHRQGLMQCSDFLKQHPHIKQVESGSTAGCARSVLEQGDITRAAIASRRAGEHFGLKLLKESIHNDENNSTRFIIITHKRIYFRGAGKTCLCFVLPHKSGSLYHMLSHFIYNGINMTRIESRPIPGKAFEYRFFVDIEGSMDDNAVKTALKCIEAEALEMKVIGSL